jgi:PAS domain S-box-containing protein
LLIDKEKKPIYVNTEFTTLTGYKLDDIISDNIFTKLIYSNNGKEKAIQELENQKNHKTEYEITCKDGQLKKFLLKVNKLKNNTIIILSNEN